MITISTDPQLLDPAFIHAFLSQTYWAKDRSLADVQTAIAHSKNFGVYREGTQIGYARVVTDYMQFAYLMDVFIAPEFRGKGYSKQLVAFILEYPDLQSVKVWKLATRDAHGLYTQFGFRPLAEPEKMMELFTKE